MRALVLALSAAALCAIPAMPAAANSALTLSCSTAGSNDVRIGNSTSVALPSGTTIKWVVNAFHASGKIVLSEELGPGQSIRLADALIVGPKSGTPCAAFALQA